jgi:hypothetical protein
VRILLLILCATLSSCVTTTPKIITSSTNFHGPQHAQRGSVSVQPIDDSQRDSLEFNAVSLYLNKKLIEKGYVTAYTIAESDYVALITYGIDNGTTITSAAPVFGQTSGGSSYTSGQVSTGVSRATFNSTTTNTPTFGLVGAVPVSRRIYTRVVLINVWRNTNPPVKVYEMKGISTGSCGNINGVVRSIIDGMFTNFPGENGITKNIDIKWEGDC